ncbi:LLM class F420-dependent oxidoreductase [Nonomuraea sp. NPDC000554]|uniref:LLM class F420-dependent oxidoreductase n=1 Tax=Nonomuraea sp. NPDC000554 TaxID=3154259 RepID=UPI0033172A6B
MKIGLELAEFGWDSGPAEMGRTLKQIARVADDAGFDLIGVGDHVWQGPHAGGPEQPQLECFTTLAVIAAHTRRCRVAPVVAGVHFRQPALLAKTVTTLDVLSGGRAMLGIGAGWYADEATGMGFPFPPLAKRFEMLEETLQICLRLWQGEHGDERPFEGAHYRLERPLNLPQSLTRPHPPIMIGGDGRKTLRLVARYADACNVYPGPDVAAKLDLLRTYCAEEGRDYDAIEKTAIFPFTVGADGTGVAELTGELRRWADAGVQTAIGIVSSTDPVRQMELIGEKVIPAVADV